MTKYKAYPSYKDSGVEWLGDVPSEWDILYGKNLFSTERNQSLKKDEQLAVTQKYGVIPQTLFMKLENQKVVLALKGTSGFRRVKKNDYVISLRSFQGGIEYSIYDGCVSPAYTVLRNKSEIDFNYYARLFKCAPYITALQSSTDSLREGKSITFEQFGSIYIPLPPLTEQKAIADFLDKATAKIDTTIEKQTKLIELLKEKRQAVISHAVTKGLDPNAPMKEYRLDWVCEVVRGNSAFKKDELLESGKYVALQYGKTYKIEQVDNSFNFYVNEEFYKPGQIVEYGDTILISTSETIKDLGHSCFYARNDIGLIGGEQILLKPINNIIFDKFLYYSSRVFCPLLSRYSTGLKVFRFSTDDLKYIFISIPNINEQKQIADYLDKKTAQIDTLVDKAKQSIELLKEKRTALISAAVTGKIDVRGA
ncbi:restriction endonuclease subunit S [Francisella philomiragia]|uniref:restriction endonuclease subunit S n=1 Tax=Francisella philomiragia TaxID=28110 RepID=UPI0019067ABF|nr:restriction endonuclease subunit S [Francisella philomiragia]MBK2297345.1 restriction endonuclease subunit S [Francisella philomiragia]